LYVEPGTVFRTVLNNRYEMVTSFV
jgi:hypothetical protein